MLKTIASCAVRIIVSEHMSVMITQGAALGHIAELRENALAAARTTTPRTIAG